MLLLNSDATFRPRTSSASFTPAAAASAVLQDEDNPSLNTSLTSANFNVITQKIENFFPTVSSVYYCLLPTSSLNSFWPFWHSSPMFGPHVYPIWLRAICVLVSALRPKLFEFGQPTFQPARLPYQALFQTPGIPKRGWVDNPSWKCGATACPVYCSCPYSWAPGCWRNRWMKPWRFANLIWVCFSCCIFFFAHKNPIIIIIILT